MDSLSISGFLLGGVEIDSTFLVLEPKKNGVDSAKDYEPINLVGLIYKLIVKVIGNRMKRVLNRIISDTEHAFVEGRPILHAASIANQAIDLMKEEEK